MFASVIQHPRTIEIIETPLPEIQDEEVLVRLDGTGVCVSNLPVWQGREWFVYPFETGAPGHEGYGTVEAIGNKVINLKKGDKVALLSFHTYAEYDKTEQSNVVKLPDKIAEKPFPGEPAACAVNIFNRSDIQQDHTVVVIGTGFIGSLLIQLLRGKCKQIIAVSRRDTSLGYAKRAGADDLVRFNDVYSTARQINEMVPGGVQRVIEATGTQAAIDLATEIVAERGKIIVAGFHQDGLRNINLQAWNWKGIDVINAHERDPKIYIDGLKEAIKLAEKGTLRMEELITHEFDFREINEAFETMDQRPEGYLKAIINFS